MQACTIGLSRGSKAREKEREKTSSATRSFIQSSSHVTTAVLPSSASAVTLPPLQKSLPSGFVVRTIPIGRSYLYTLSVAYRLYYTSILSIYLGILAV